MLALRRAAQRLAADAWGAGGLECSTSGRVAAQAAARFSAAAAEVEQGEETGRRSTDVGLMGRHLGHAPPPPPAATPAVVECARVRARHETPQLAEPTLVAELRGSAGTIASNKLRRVRALLGASVLPATAASERASQRRPPPSLLLLTSPWLCSFMPAAVDAAATAVHLTAGRQNPGDCVFGTWRGAAAVGL